MDAKRKAALLYNPRAGTRSPDRRLLETLLRPHFDLVLFDDCRGKKTRKRAEQALRQGAELLVAAGGDGTVSRVADVVAGSECALGIVPRGTSNAIARELGIPEDVRAAAALIVDGAERRIDVARANDRTMVLYAGAGLPAAVLARTRRSQKNTWGFLAYVANAARELTRLEPFRVSIDTDAERIECLATAITVANLAPPSTVLAQGPAAISPTDGTLDVTIVAADTLASAVSAGLHLLRVGICGEPATRDDIGWFSARRVVIDTDPPQRIAIDGRKAGRGRLSVAIRPGALRVVAPPLEKRTAPADEHLEGLPELAIVGHGQGAEPSA